MVFLVNITKSNSALSSQLAKALLEQLGFKDVLRVIKHSWKPIYETGECVGCDKCVFICPYDAIESEELATPKINYDLCVGCGACAIVCPHLAIQVAGFEFERVSNLIKRYGESARKLETDGKSPIILAFCCQCSEFSALDDAESPLFNKKAVAMEAPCFKALDPVQVIDAFYSGFDGVMSVVCAEEDYRLQEDREHEIPL